MFTHVLLCWFQNICNFINHYSFYIPINFTISWINDNITNLRGIYITGTYELLFRHSQSFYFVRSYHCTGTIFYVSFYKTFRPTYNTIQSTKAYQLPLKTYRFQCSINCYAGWTMMTAEVVMPLLHLLVEVI